jgi:hypothetical protein
MTKTTTQPKVGDQTTMWDEDEGRWFTGVIDHTDDAGTYFFIRCTDGVMAECFGDDLTWDGSKWVEAVAS